MFRLPATDSSATNDNVSYRVVRPVSAVRPASVTDNLRAKYHNISGYEVLLE